MTVNDCRHDGAPELAMAGKLGEAEFQMGQGQKVAGVSRWAGRVPAVFFFALFFLYVLPNLPPTEFAAWDVRSGLEHVRVIPLNKKKPLVPK